MYAATWYDHIDPIFGRQLDLTGFRRSVDQIKSLEAIFKDDLLGKKGSRIEIAIAGCSTGQEVYSYALLCAASGYQDFQVDGYDLYEDRLDEGRKRWYGIYWGTETELLGDQYLREGLAVVATTEEVEDGTTQKIHFSERIRWSVAFYQHDFSLRPFPKQYDLIVATNVLHQRQSGGRENAVRNLLRSLKKGGLFVQNYFSHDHPSVRAALEPELVNRLNGELMQKLGLLI